MERESERERERGERERKRGEGGERECERRERDTHRTHSHVCGGSATAPLVRWVSGAALRAPPFAVMDLAAKQKHSSEFLIA